MCEGVLCVFPSSDEEGWPRHQKNIATASFGGADGVVSTRKNHFLANTTPSALARSHPASAEAGKSGLRNPLASILWRKSLLQLPRNLIQSGLLNQIFQFPARASLGSEMFGNFVEHPENHRGLLLFEEIHLQVEFGSSVPFLRHAI